MPIDEAWKIPAFLLAAIWVVFIFDWMLKRDLRREGIVPRSKQGLFGILFAPFLHGDVRHIAGNSVPLFVLALLLMLTGNRPVLVLLVITVVSGCLIWLFGKKGSHIGASYVIFGLVTYLITIAVLDRNVVSIATAVITGLLYGGVLRTGFIPREGVSWDGHLCGAITGIGIAFAHQAMLVAAKTSG